MTSRTPCRALDTPRPTRATIAPRRAGIGPAPEPPSERLVDPKAIIRVVKGIMEDPEERTQDQLAAAKLLMQHAGMLTPDKDPDAGGGQGPVIFNINIEGSAIRAGQAVEAIDAATVPEPPVNPL